MVDSFKLPPLSRETQAPKTKSWLGRKSDNIDRILAGAVNSPISWWRSNILHLSRVLLRLTSYFGQTFPYAYRPWFRLSVVMRNHLDKRFKKTRVETVRTLFLRRLFSLTKPVDKKFHPSYAFINWISFLIFVSILPSVVGILIEGIYVYSTYDTYRNVVVTQAYRNITDQSTFSVHGYEELPNGQTKELYFEIGANLWHWNLYPEFIFGQVAVNGRCTFDTFGKTLRIPRRLSMFSHGSLYVLNPWIIDLKCTAPSNVPK